MHMENITLVKSKVHKSDNWENSLEYNNNYNQSEGDYV